MSEQKIGAALDALGLTVHLRDGAEITDAFVKLTVDYPDHRAVERARAPQLHPGGHPVPCPHEERIVTVMHSGAVLNEEQTDRIEAWLTANHIDPRNIPATKEIKIRYRGCQPMILISQYFQDEDGHREYNYDTKDVAMVQRTIPMEVPLPPQPELEPTYGTDTGMRARV